MSDANYNGNDSDDGNGNIAIAISNIQYATTFKMKYNNTDAGD